MILTANGRSFDADDDVRATVMIVSVAGPEFNPDAGVRGNRGISAPRTSASGLNHGSHATHRDETLIESQYPVLEDSHMLFSFSLAQESASMLHCTQMIPRSNHMNPKHRQKATFLWQIALHSKVSRIPSSSRIKCYGDE